MGVVYSTLFSNIWSKLFGSQEYKLVIVGLDNAGKTTTLYKLHLGEIVLTTPTIGSNVEEVTHKNVRFQCWDLGGQENLRPSWNLYFANTDAVVLVVDSTDRERMHLVKEELWSMLAHKDLSQATLLVMANKQDKRGAMTAGEVSKALHLHNIKNIDWHIQASCALTGDGLLEGMDWVTTKIKDKK